MINFTIKHADGTNVTFVDTESAVKVSAWTDTNFVADDKDTDDAIFDSEKHQWQAGLPEVDPRNKSVHIDFEIRDPATTVAQQHDITTRFRFSDVPIPIKANVREALHYEYTSPRGTNVTLTGLTLTAGQSGGGSTSFDFVTDHSEVFDDIPMIELNGFYDKDVRLFQASQWLYDVWCDDNTIDSVTLIGPKIEQGSHAALTFEFSLQESSLDIVQSTHWKAVQMEIPLAGIPKPNISTSFTPLGHTSQGAIKYQIDVISSQWNPGFHYALWTKSADPGRIYRVTGDRWTSPAGMKGVNASLQSNTQRNIYWHADGSQVMPGEYGAVGTYNWVGSPIFPLYVAVQSSRHDQKIIAFSKVPVPAMGRTLIIDQKPDKKFAVPIRLRAVSYVWSDWDKSYRKRSAPSQIKLTFEYNVADGSDISLFTLSASDRAGNSLNYSYDYPVKQKQEVDRSLQVLTDYIAVPPTGSKSIDLSFILTKDTPTGSPAIFSIDRAGKWTSVDSSTLPDV
jgi:hypothetical protein